VFHLGVKSYHVYIGSGVTYGLYYIRRISFAWSAAITAGIRIYVMKQIIFYHVMDFIGLAFGTSHIVTPSVSRVYYVVREIFLNINFLFSRGNVQPTEKTIDGIFDLVAKRKIKPGLITCRILSGKAGSAARSAGHPRFASP
jgi:hypothetical protein